MSYIIISYLFLSACNWFICVQMHTGYKIKRIGATLLCHVTNLLYMFKFELLDVEIPKYIFSAFSVVFQTTISYLILQNTE